jgi:hypothetical protein
MGNSIEDRHMKVLIRFIDAARSGKAQEFFANWKNRAELWSAEISMRARLDPKRETWNRSPWMDPETMELKENYPIRRGNENHH